MTPTRGPVEDLQEVIIVGAAAAGRAAATALQAAGITDFLILGEASGTDGERHLTGREVISSVFDDNTDAWALRTAAGEVLHSRVVIACHRPPHVPWTPNFPVGNAFGGVSFHAARWEEGFDPTGRRVAVIGADGSAGHHLGRLVESAASVTVFLQPPRRVVAELPLPMTRAGRWLRRRLPTAAHRERSKPAPIVLGSAIDALTPSGLRTREGLEHRFDAIVFGTGFTIADHVDDQTMVGAGGLTIRQAWHDGMEPYFGVAVHGFPNYFFVTGPDINARARYVADCVSLMKRRASTRIEVRGSSQQVYNERAFVKPFPPPRVTSAFELSSDGAADDGTYDGAATLTLGGTDHPVRVRLTGHLDPIDGRYHWQGTVFSSPAQPLPEEVSRQARTATVTVGRRSAPARITEQTPWGTHSVAGVGTPPYALSES